MKFKGWQKTSLIEYPGKVSTVLFSGGCNFRCPFCYNRDLVLAPDGILDIESSLVLSFLQNNKNLYQAVIVTGGEPTRHEELPAFFSKIKELELLTGLETNGTNPRMLELLMSDRLVDFIGLDLKAPPVFEKYALAAGIMDEKLLENVLESVKLLMASDLEYELRCTVVPGIHEEEDLLKLADFLEGARKLVLQQFIPGHTLAAPFETKRPFPRETLLKWQEKIKDKFESCELRNI